MAVMNTHNISRGTQHGGALIILVMVLVLAGMVAIFSVLDGRDVQIERNKANAEILADAKIALIGYAIGAIGGGQRPGDLIMPDAFSATEVPGNYDGSADGGCLDSTKVNGLPLINSDKNMRCLGRLPWKDLGLSIRGSSENDPNGIMPWYAVSGNLVDPTCLAVLNPNTLNLVNNPPPAPLDCTGATLPYPWLTVRDSVGNILSNRVAAVIFISGVVRGAQSRPSAPLASVNQYLDTLVVPAGCAAPCVSGTYNNAAMNNDFIIASETATNNFNDQLIYITIEELMAAVVGRAAGEARSVLKGYRSQNSNYPYAAPLGSTINNFISSGTNTGMLPIDGTDTCFCSSGASCTCGYGLVNSVAHTRSSGGNYNSVLSSGSCISSGTKCTCTGVGQCKNTTGTRTFTCVTGGNCTFAGSGATPLFTYTPRLTHGKVASAFAGCSVVGGNATCNANGTFRVGLKVPQWFTDNLWQEYFYYQWSATSDIQTGQHGSVAALVIGTGNTLINAPFTIKGSPQSRPSVDILDYLDSAENINLDAVFDGLDTPRSSTYNDQMFIVAP
ncbi:MAG: hypothetical protein ABL859_08030 [Methylotenera sp.]